MDTRFKRKLLLALGIRNYLALAIEFLSHNMYKQEIIESRKAVTLGNQYLAVSLENNSLDHHKL